MTVHDSITFIISKNYGRPLSWSMPVWRVYAGGAVCMVLIVVLTAFSVMYVLTYRRVQQMESDRQQLREERDALQEQLLSASQAAYEAKESAFAARMRQGTGDSGKAPLAASARRGEELYEPPIRVVSLTTRVRAKIVEVSFRLKNQGDPSSNRGGFLFAIFENDEREPAHFIATPTVNTNAEGFPQTYKSGIRFTRIRDAVTFRRRVRRQSTQAYFTHVTLYLFSVRGGLLLKERYELERDLFDQDQPASRTQQFSSA